jgi:hypothetical protein
MHFKYSTHLTFYRFESRLIVFDKLYDFLISELINNFWLTMIETKIKFSKSVFWDDESRVFRINEICINLDMFDWIIFDDIEIKMLFQFENENFVFIDCVEVYIS